MCLSVSVCASAAPAENSKAIWLPGAAAAGGRGHQTQVLWEEQQAVKLLNFFSTLGVWVCFLLLW